MRWLYFFKRPSYRYWRCNGEETSKQLLKILHETFTSCSIFFFLEFYINLGCYCIVQYCTHSVYCSNNCVLHIYTLRTKLCVSIVIFFFHLHRSRSFGCHYFWDIIKPKSRIIKNRNKSLHKNIIIIWNNIHVIHSIMMKVRTYPFTMHNK